MPKEIPSLFVYGAVTFRELEGTLGIENGAGAGGGPRDGTWCIGVLGARVIGPRWTRAGGPGTARSRAKASTAGGCPNSGQRAKYGSVVTLVGHTEGTRYVEFGARRSDLHSRRRVATQLEGCGRQQCRLDAPEQL